MSEIEKAIDHLMERGPKQEFKVGDVVKYSREFLRNTGQQTGDAPFATGTITGLQTLGSGLTLATIDWGNPELPDKVNVNNLILKSKIHLEPA